MCVCERKTIRASGEALVCLSCAPRGLFSPFWLFLCLFYSFAFFLLNIYVVGVKSHGAGSASHGTGRKYTKSHGTCYLGFKAI